MSKLWTKARRERKERREMKRFQKYTQSLEYRLCETLSHSAGERGFGEGAEDTLHRIIRERDQALLILAMDRLNNFRPL
jgi:hypothetical protein